MDFAREAMANASSVCGSQVLLSACPQAKPEWRGAVGVTPSFVKLCSDGVKGRPEVANLRIASLLEARIVAECRRTDE